MDVSHKGDDRFSFATSSKGDFIRAWELEELLRDHDLTEYNGMSKVLTVKILCAPFT